MSKPIVCECGFGGAFVNSRTETDDEDLYLKTKYFVECPVCGFEGPEKDDEQEAIDGAWSDY